MSWANQTGVATGSPFLRKVVRLMNSSSWIALNAIKLFGMIILFLMHNQQIDVGINLTREILSLPRCLSPGSFLSVGQRDRITGVQERNCSDDEVLHREIVGRLDARP